MRASSLRRSTPLTTAAIRSALDAGSRSNSVKIARTCGAVTAGALFPQKLLFAVEIHAARDRPPRQPGRIAEADAKFVGLLGHTEGDDGLDHGCVLQGAAEQQSTKQEKLLRGRSPVCTDSLDSQPASRGAISGLT
jgi:hypothetical protein